MALSAHTLENCIDLRLCLARTCVYLQFLVVPGFPFDQAQNCVQVDATVSYLVTQLHVAKCNLGKVNLEAMLSSNRWMQEARLQPWWFAGALCDAYTQ